MLAQHRHRLLCLRLATGAPASPRRRRRPASRSCPIRARGPHPALIADIPTHPCSALQPAAGLPGPSAPSLVASVVLLFLDYFSMSETDQLEVRTTMGALATPSASPAANVVLR